MLTALSPKMLGHLATQAQTGGWSEAVADRQHWLPGAIAALGIAMITTVLLRRWLKRTRQVRQAAGAPIREQRERLQGRAERDSLDRLMVEVQELTRVCAAQIENRATKLEYLIELADQRLNELQRACEDAERRIDSRSSGPTDSAVVRATRTTASTGDWSSPSATVEAARDSNPGDQLSRRVHELSQMGLKSIEIARQLDEQVGKVELILALREAS